ncbi:hypothetical protein GCM10027059_25950 [Myceligenerans halotolerans]
MRIRVLPLPPESVGGVTAAPYGVVFDMLTSHEAETVADQAESLRNTMGARFVICATTPVDLDGLVVDADLDELRETLGARGIKVA